MEKTFYVVYNENMDKFMSIYEDGEGNEYYSLVSFDELYQGGLFPSKELAEFKLKEAINIAGFGRFMPSGMREFCMDADVLEVNIRLNRKELLS